MFSKSRILSCFIVLVLIFAVGCAPKTTSPAPPTSVTQFGGIIKKGSIPYSQDPELFGQYWSPIKDPKALILLLHGTTLHSGAYSQAGKYLASNGYLVYGLDMRGWGRSEKQNGYVKSPDRYVRDIKLAIRQLEQNYPDKNLYVLGESLGATVSIYGYLKYGLDVDGMIFSGPGYKPNVKFLGIRGPRFMHNFYMGMGAELGEWIPSWPTLPSDLGLRMVVDDPKMQQRLLNDPHVTHDWLPAAYLTTLSKADEYNQKHIEELNLPLLVVHGVWDELIPVQSSRELVKRASSTNKKLMLYNSNHATLLDTKRFQVYRDIEYWLDKQERSY